MAEDTLRAALASLTAETGRDDWGDVLSRSTRRARRRGRAVRFAIVPMMCLLVVVPALAATGGLHGLTRDRPHARFAAVLRTPDGRDAGRLDLVTTGSTWPFLRLDGRFLPPPRRLPGGHRRPFARTFTFRWTLDVHGLGGGVDRGTLAIAGPGGRAGRRVATVCSPCRDGDSGTLRLNGRRTVALVSGHVTFTLSTARSAHAASGPVVIRRKR